MVVFEIVVTRDAAFYHKYDDNPSLRRAVNVRWRFLTSARAHVPVAAAATAAIVVPAALPIVPGVLSVIRIRRRRSSPLLPRISDDMKVAQLELTLNSRCFGGQQKVYAHDR